MDSMGKTTGLPKHLPLDHLSCFPNLTRDNHRVTSSAISAYNCVAYAAGDETRKWDPYGHYWPPGAIRNHTIDALFSAFEAIGYSQCVGGALEKNIEKVALFVSKHNAYEHAAKQRKDGTWTSKLGDSFDICHDSAFGVEGATYGKLIYFMKREKR